MIEKIYNIFTKDIKWEEVWKYPEFQKLKFRHENNFQHGDIFVSNHVVQVVQNVRKYIELNNISDELAKILILAALFHDIGKVETALFSIEGNDWVFPNHAYVGEKITRNLLKDEDEKLREEICYFVRNHMVLNYILNNPLGIRNLIKVSCDTIYDDVCNIQNLLILRNCDNQTIVSLNVKDDNDEKEFIEDLAKEMDCLTKHYEFENPTSKFNFFNETFDNYPLKKDKKEYDFSVICFIGEIKDKTQIAEIDSYEEIKFFVNDNEDEAFEQIEYYCATGRNFSIRIDDLPIKVIEKMIEYFKTLNGNIHFMYGKEYQNLISPTLCMEYTIL